MLDRIPGSALIAHLSTVMYVGVARMAVYFSVSAFKNGIFCVCTWEPYYITS